MFLTKRAWLAMAVLCTAVPLSATAEQEPPAPPSNEANDNPFLGVGVPFICAICVFGVLLVVVYHPWSSPQVGPDQVLVGRWMKVVLNTYQEECTVGGVDPFGHLPPAAGTDHVCCESRHSGCWPFKRNEESMGSLPVISPDAEKADSASISIKGSACMSAATPHWAAPAAAQPTGKPGEAAGAETGTVDGDKATHQTEAAEGEERERLKSFLTAVNTARERLFQETSSLMVVTGLLANLSLMLAQATSSPSPYKFCPVDSSPNNSACTSELRPILTGLPFEGDDENRWLMACLIFSIISFFCGMVQLLLGAVCGIFTVGRSPQTFVRFLFWGEFLPTAGVYSFAASVGSLAVAAILYTHQLLLEAGFSNAVAGGMAIVLGVGVFACLLIFIYLDRHQKDWQQGCTLVVYQAQLLALEPFLARSVLRSSKGALSWSAPPSGLGSSPSCSSGFWPPLRAYIALNSCTPTLLTKTMHTLGSVLWLAGPTGLIPGVVRVWRFSAEEKAQIRKLGAARCRRRSSMAG